MDWSNATVISEGELGRYIFQADTEDRTELCVKQYSIEVGPQGWNYNDFARYCGDRFVYFVFPENKVKELQEEDRQPHPRALEIAGIKANYERDGTLGEFILFLIVDGFFDIPMVSHKIASTQNFNLEVAGSDGVFFGELNSSQCIGLGEAKVYKNFQNAIDSAIASLNRFHEVGSSTAIKQELNIAPTNLSENLSTEQLEILAEALTERKFSNYPLFHPVLICYEESQFDISQMPWDANESALRSEIISILKEKECLEPIEDKIDSENYDISQAYLLFITLAVSDLDRFRKEILLKIDPGLKHILGD